MRVFVPLSILVFGVRLAEATESETASTYRPTEPFFVGEHDLRFGGGVGIFGNSTDAGVLFSGYALLHWDAVEAGLAGHVGGAGLNYDFAGGGFLGGLGGTTRWGLRGDVLGELGLEHYSGVDTEKWFVKGGDPGGSATLAYAGVRGGLSYQFARRARSHFELGVWGIYQDDLARVAVRYAYVDASLGGPPLVTTAEHSVGSSRVLGLFVLGGSFDLGAN
jgi:hypothetical protein